MNRGEQPLRVVGTGMAVALAALALNGCGSSSGTERGARAPALSVSLLQYRADYTPRRIQLKVSNDGDRPVSVLTARLHSPRFAADAVWANGPESIPPRSRTDLPALLADSRCPTARTPADTAVVDFRLADGATGTVTLPVRDPFMSLDKVNAQDCLRQEALAIASIEIVEPLRTRRVRGRFTASIELRMTPTGRPGTLTLQSVSPTTLLSPPTGASWTVGVTVAAGTGPQTITLPLRAARCDLHAIGEDKLGTVLPVTVQVGGGTGVLSRPSSPPMRRQIYDFLAKACGRED